MLLLLLLLFNKIVCLIYRGLLVCFSQWGTGVTRPPLP